MSSSFLPARAERYSFLFAGAGFLLFTIAILLDVASFTRVGSVKASVLALGAGATAVLLAAFTGSRPAMLGYALATTALLAFIWF